MYTNIQASLITVVHKYTGIAYHGKQSFGFHTTTLNNLLTTNNVLTIDNTGQLVTQ